MFIRRFGVRRSRLICMRLAAELYVFQLKITFTPAPHAYGTSIIKHEIDLRPKILWR